MSDLEARIRELDPEQRRKLRARLETRRRAAADSGPIPRVERTERGHPVSFSQERLWFLDQLAPGNAAYNLSFAQRLAFAVSVPALEAALADLAHRHEALRTSFTSAGGEPLQRVDPLESVACPVVDLGSLPPASVDLEVRRLGGELAQTPFDLSRAPLFRATLIRAGDASVFLFVIHHIVADAWSLEVLFRDLGKLYAERTAGRSVPLTETNLQYVDFSVWQRGRLQGERLERELAYWRRALQDLPKLDLATDRQRPPVQRYRGDQVAWSLSGSKVAALRRLGGEAGATPFMVLLAAFYVLLSRYSRQRDLVVGTPIANRRRAELEDVVGFFANTLVLRCDLDGAPSFRELMARVRAMTLDAYDHQDLPFSRLVAALRPEQDLSVNPLFQVSFQLVSSAGVAQAGAHGPQGSMTVERSTAIFDLTLNLWDTGTDVRGLLEYSTDLFDRATIEALADNYAHLIDGALERPDDPVERLPLLGEAQRRRWLVDWNADAVPADRTDAQQVPVSQVDSFPELGLFGLFARQAEATPDAVAVRRGETALSYRALAARAARVAAALRVCDARTKRHVGILLEPGFDLVAGILGILHSGNAYVPLDATAPPERLAPMLADAAIEVVLTSRTLEPRCAALTVQSLVLDDVSSEGDDSDTARAPATAPEDCAYVVFTSGSTGRPKGVRVSQRSATGYVESCARTYPVHAGCGAPLTSLPSSDMAVTSLFVPLATGGAVHVLEGDDTIEALDRALRTGPEFSFVKLTPTHLVALHNLALGRGAPSGTHAFIVGGEALRGEDVALWRESAPTMRFFNEYGPTEATVGCCLYELLAGAAEAGAVPIGRPFAGSRLYVLDEHRAPVGLGVPGELYIGGPGVALDYAAAPEATAASFLDDHVSGTPGARLYRTGDLVRHRSDGDLEYLGRLDRQLKIRGHRVEPADLEAALRLHADVADAAVIASDYGDHDRRLVALVVRSRAEGVEGVEPEALRAYLHGKVPLHMIPAHVVVIAEIPRTASGKTDVQALAELARAREPDRSESLAPRTALEDVIARVFAEILRDGRIGVRDDFFAKLGGDSLLATRAVARLRELFQVELPLRTLFEAPTVEGIAGALQAGGEACARIEATADVLLEILALSDEQVEAELREDASPDGNGGRA
ncbi:MAG: amino acid adenylation domain-containing protein [bacterium]|nr:amino acid adenylation domain-containing protein [bacterium]